MAEFAPPHVSANGAAPDRAVTSLPSLVEQLTTRIEALLSAVSEQPAQQARLQAQVDALRLEQTALAAGTADLRRRVDGIVCQHEALRGVEATAVELQRRGDEVARRPEVATPADQLLERLQQRVDELARQDGAIGQAVQALTERVRLLAQAGASEFVSPSQIIASAGVSSAAHAPAGGVGAQDEPFVVTIGSIRTEGELRRLREAIEHLPSVAAVDAAPLEAGSVRFMVRLRETWPRSSFTRQMSWLEGLRLSLIFTGPDGLRADLLSAEGETPKPQTSWLRRHLRRAATRSALGGATGGGP